MEQIYNDFTTKLLPKIQEGLTITKDYFVDLFSRYVHFLFIVDTLTAVLGFIALITTLYLTFRKNGFVRWIHSGGEWDSREFAYIPIVIVMVVSFIVMISGTINAIKDKYIPEIRVIEKIQDFRANNTNNN